MSDKEPQKEPAPNDISPRLVTLKRWADNRIDEIASEISVLCDRMTDEMIDEMRAQAPIRDAQCALNDAPALRAALSTMLLKRTIMRIIVAIPVGSVPK